MTRAPILVTGASRGVGRAVSERLLAAGRPVIGIHRGTTAFDLPGLESVIADLADEAAPSAIARALAGRTLAGIVSAAGVMVRGPFAVVPEEGPDPLRLLLRVDLEAPLMLLRALLNASALPRGAAVVLVSSNLARRALPGTTAYGVAKAGLERAVRGLAHELGPLGIRINAVAPGLLRTDMTADLDEAGFAAYAAEVPLRRVGEAADVVGPIAFLLGDDAAYVTGQVLDVDGGWGA